MNVLVIKANNRPASEGVSSKMYETFMEAIQNNSELKVTTYDVFAEEMPYFGQELFDAFGKLQTGAELNKTEQTLLNAKQKAMDLLTAADLVVFAFPLWNLTIPARLQTFIDYTYAAGYSFKYDENGNMINLMTDKKAIFLNARGGVYSIPEMNAMDMSINYLRNVIGGIYGMEIIDEVIIEGHNASPDKAEEIIQNGLERVKEAASKLSLQNV
ncbi:FMN-dependent NADH-azoreductase [Alkalihalobacillus trypoxylicola]|uniref:FMN dependent NADH:quinone oxidoreductase n=1 Tax=Alkalihalobacillus trypoxylicola TaxID=519424 RepID=A0A161QKN3_9BACI|nr:FMN-dependent NADH-azoreductase [Alkalihalobacillus trypoxylicola]KYG30546.1 FMN-dependent NADH-azoreductase [Alkalihalobacillus trypoxylicola]